MISKGAIISGVTRDGNGTLVVCYQNAQITCDILRSDSIQTNNHPSDDTIDRAIDLWSLGYARFGNQQKFEEWNTITSYSSKKKC